MSPYLHCIIHKAIANKAKVLILMLMHYASIKRLKNLRESGGLIVTLDLPSSSIFEWDIVSEANFAEISQKVPCAGTPTGFWGLGHLQEMRPLTIHVGAIM